jgi:cap2 methyltransferase
LLYIGASPGHHINYLIKMFPDINYILYDKVDTGVEPRNNVKFYKKYFTDDEANKYKNMNIFIICDIRSLEIAKFKKKSRSSNNLVDEIIYDDMTKQKKWC